MNKCWGTRKVGKIKGMTYMNETRLNTNGITLNEKKNLITIAEEKIPSVKVR